MENEIKSAQNTEQPIKPSEILYNALPKGLGHHEPNSKAVKKLIKKLRNIVRF